MKQYLLLLGCIAWGCADPSGPTIERLAANPGVVILQQGESVQLSASAIDEDGAAVPGIAFTFVSDDPTVVSVTEDGLAEAVGSAGETSIRISGGGLTTAVPVTVTAVAATLELSPDSTTLDQLGTLQLTATVRDLAGDEIAGAPVNFWTPDWQIAFVSQDGMVTSAGPHGSATIMASYGGLSAQATVIINQVPASIFVPPGSFVVGAGDTALLGAIVYDRIGTPMPGEAISYAPNNPNLINLDAQGLITSLGPLGSTTLALTSGSLGTSMTVRVVPILTPVAFDSVAGNPYAAAISSVGVIYVATLSGTLERSSLAAFDFFTAVQGLGNPRVVAFNAAGDQAYVAGSPLAGVSFIDVASNIMTSYMGGLPGIPSDIAVGSDGTIYLATNGLLYAIDPATETVIDQLTTGSEAHLALHPSQPLIYLSALQVGKIFEISTTTLDVVRQFNSGGNPVQDLTVSPDGNNLYVIDEGSGNLQIIALGSGTEQFIDAGCAGWSLLLSQDGNEIYVGCSSRDMVNRVDLTTSTIAGTLRVSRPRRMALASDGISVVIPSQDGKIILLQ